MVFDILHEDHQGLFALNHFHAIGPDLLFFQIRVFLIDLNAMRPHAIGALSGLPMLLNHEAVTNVVVGYGVAVMAQILVLPMFELQVNLADNLPIGAIFTAASIIRSHSLRRVFEAIRTQGLIPEYEDAIKEG